MIEFQWRDLTQLDLRELTLARPRAPGSGRLAAPRQDRPVKEPISNRLDQSRGAQAYGALKSDLEEPAAEGPGERRTLLPALSARPYLIENAVKPSQKCGRGSNFRLKKAPSFWEFAATPATLAASSYTNEIGSDGKTKENQLVTGFAEASPHPPSPSRSAEVRDPGSQRWLWWAPPFGRPTATRTS
jgi:hypothetical protein